MPASPKMQSNDVTSDKFDTHNEYEHLQNRLRRPIITLKSLEELQRGSLAMMESEDLPQLVFNDFLSRFLSHWYYFAHLDEITSIDPDKIFMERSLCLDFVD